MDRAPQITARFSFDLVIRPKLRRILITTLSTTLKSPKTWSHTVSLKPTDRGNKLWWDVEGGRFPAPASQPRDKMCLDLRALHPERKPCTELLWTLTTLIKTKQHSVHFLWQTRVYSSRVESLCDSLQTDESYPDCFSRLSSLKTIWGFERNILPNMNFVDRQVLVWKNSWSEVCDEAYRTSF